LVITVRIGFGIYQYMYQTSMYIPVISVGKLIF